MQRLIFRLRNDIMVTERKEKQHHEKIRTVSSADLNVQQDIPASCDVIAIRDSAAPNDAPQLTGIESCRNVLTLCFDDITAETADVVLFSADIAAQIIEFLRAHTSAETLLLCVSAVQADFYGLRDAGCFERDELNQHVYDTLSYTHVIQQIAKKDQSDCFSILTEERDRIMLAKLFGFRDSFAALRAVSSKFEEIHSEGSDKDLWESVCKYLNDLLVQSF